MKKYNKTISMNGMINANKGVVKNEVNPESWTQLKGSNETNF